MAHEIDTVRNNVRDLLSKYSDCRDNDNYLILNYWIHYDKLDSSLRLVDLWQIEIYELTPASSIFRARQLVQNEEGLYPPTENVKGGRRIKEDKIHNYCRTSSQKNSGDRLYL